MRLDITLVKRGLFTGRDRAKDAIIGARVSVNKNTITKPSYEVSDDDFIHLLDEGSDFVSRGGNKLEYAINVFDIDLKGAVVADVGAATGGFTDCMLRHGAVKSYAIDSGTNQLIDSLRRDTRVISLENMNIRTVKPDIFDEKPDFIAVDVSFISLSLVLPVLKTLCGEKTRIVCLVKPQFEAGRGNVGKKGVVRDPKIHEKVLNSFIECAGNSGLFVWNLTYSPIKGPEGNIEFLAYLGMDLGVGARIDIANTVKNAHERLKGN